MLTFKKYFLGSSIFTIICLAGGFLAGFLSTGTLLGGFSTLFIVLVLGVLETSLSFDNAIVNVGVLKTMDKKRRKRFLTWGILIAVFGMRVLFPIVLVSLFANISPRSSLQLALTDAKMYGEILESAHVTINGFGGAFLLMVGLKFFLNKEKDVHRIHALEKRLTKLGKIEAIEAALVLLFLEIVSRFLPAESASQFMFAGVRGVVTYILINGISALFLGDTKHHGAEIVAKSGIRSFLYLEVLDASFSLDGVIGAFALSTNLIVIACGLGIGAYFVRSITIYLFDTGTLAKYSYLEHGAFYAIVALASMMMINTFFHISEIVMGLIGGVVILLALRSSYREGQRTHV